MDLTPTTSNIAQCREEIAVNGGGRIGGPLRGYRIFFGKINEKFLFFLKILPGKSFSSLKLLRQTLHSTGCNIVWYLGRLDD